MRVEHFIELGWAGYFQFFSVECTRKFRVLECLQVLKNVWVLRNLLVPEIVLVLEYLRVLE